jgi:peptidylprolyl isomerase
MSRILFVVFVVFSAVALGLPHSALAQAPAQSTMAAQVENPPADALKTASGVAYKVESPGSGTVHPTDADLVKIAASFWTRESQADKPGSFGPPTRPLQMSQILLPGLHEALGLMTIGQKLKLWLPEKLAFAGAAGKPKGPLMLELVLLDVVPVPTAPADVAAAPADAQKTKSGLATKVLKAGTGTVHPTSTSTVTVHYTGWTTDGRMFDSSVLKGAPASFPLDKVIKGWTEGVQLMVPGESRRFWIPGKLAYDAIDRPDVPKGMLVFDIELLAVDGNR